MIERKTTRKERLKEYLARKKEPAYIDCEKCGVPVSKHRGLKLCISCCPMSERNKILNKVDRIG